MSVASAVYDSTCVVCDWVNNIVRRTWLRIQNKRAQQWIDNELKMRNITKFKKITA